MIKCHYRHRKGNWNALQKSEEYKTAVSQYAEVKNQEGEKSLNNVENAAACSNLATPGSRFAMT